MLFNSFEFLIFFPLVVGLYFAIPSKWRWLLLLGASYYFYMCWKAEYIILIIASTLIDYFAAHRMSRLSEQSRRKKYLVLSLLSNLGILFGFKYFNFFNDSLRALFNEFNIFYNVPAFDVLLPVGISFYTFQTLSYTIDVYRGKVEPETHLGKFALYVSFFPQLVAGPIERSYRLMPQLQNLTSRFDYTRVVEGLRLMLWGLFKKVVIADRLANYVNLVYNNPQDFHGFHVLLGTVFFAFQIFCDFSGYSDIAIGAARVLGIDLMNNFNKPYFSQSISEFWRRWHISLSTWFKDYVYIPLGGNRTVKWRWYYNLFITFLVSGLWHGANWTFVVWGALHGGYLVFSLMTRPLRQRMIAALGLSKTPVLLKGLRILTTFALVCFGWVFFRANSLSDALLLLNNMLIFDPATLLHHPIKNSDLVLNFFFIATLELSHLWQGENKFSQYLSDKPYVVRWATYIFFTAAILYFGGQGGQQFIYFQF